MFWKSYAVFKCNWWVGLPFSLYRIKPTHIKKKISLSLRLYAVMRAEVFVRLRERELGEGARRPL